MFKNFRSITDTLKLIFATVYLGKNIHLLFFYFSLHNVGTFTTNIKNKIQHKLFSIYKKLATEYLGKFQTILKSHFISAETYSKNWYFEMLFRTVQKRPVVLAHGDCTLCCVILVPINAFVSARGYFRPCVPKRSYLVPI